MKIRLFLFIFSIIFGIFIGVLYGWFINPVDYSQVQLSSLRPDFKTDYVLMVAESYHEDRDVAMAANWLKSLGDESPVRISRTALDTAQELGYDEDDVELLNELSEAFVLWSKEEVENE